MTDTHIKCPSCGYEIPISEALGAQIRGELELRLKADHEAHLRRAVAEAEQRARGGLDLELADLKAQIVEGAAQAEAAAARELELRRKTREPRRPRGASIPRRAECWGWTGRGLRSPLRCRIAPTTPGTEEVDPRWEQRPRSALPRRSRHPRAVGDGKLAGR